MDRNMTIFRRGRDTSLPNDPRDASVTVRMLYTKALIDLHRFLDDPVRQEAYALRFSDSPRFIESPPERSACLEPMGSLSPHLLAISSDSAPGDPNNIGGYQQDGTGTKKKKIDEGDEYHILMTEELMKRLQTGCSSSTSEGDCMDEDKENVPMEENTLETEDNGMDADAEDEGEDDGEIHSILGNEDQQARTLESETENIEEELRGRSRRRKRLNGHSSRSSSGSLVVHRPLKKKPKATTSGDSDVLMEDADDRDTRNITTSEGEFCADDLMLPPLTRTTRREPMY